MFAFWGLFIYFVQAALQFYVALRILGRHTSAYKIALFACFQTISATLIFLFIPIRGLQFVLASSTYMLFHMWLLEASLFPEVVFCYLFPVALELLGDIVVSLFGDPSLPPFFSVPLTWQLFDPSNYLVSLLPSAFLASFFWLKDRFFSTQKLKGGGIGGKRTRFYMLGLTTIGIMQVIWFIWVSETANISLPMEHSFFFATILVFPLLGFALYQEMNIIRQITKRLQYQTRQSTLQKSALRALREERHDFLNELALISTYVEMGKKDEALSCITYTAASLSERYNYVTLPDDAWLTVLAIKYKEAEHRGILFTVNIEEDVPESFTERRLLPKLLTNLIDNAFTAVANEFNPRVTLTWQKNSENERILSVANNGLMIAPWDRSRIWEGGVSSKEDEFGNSGWGLVICKRIAQELGAILSLESDPEQTIFSLKLPPQTGP